MADYQSNQINNLKFKVGRAFLLISIIMGMFFLYISTEMKKSLFYIGNHGSTPISFDVFSNDIWALADISLILINVLTAFSLMVTCMNKNKFFIIRTVFIMPFLFCMIGYYIACTVLNIGDVYLLILSFPLAMPAISGFSCFQKAVKG